MQRNVYVYIFIMFAVTYLIRVLPLTLIRRPIRSRFLRSFLFYVPYVTLAVMTFPDILSAGADCGRGARLQRPEPADGGCALLRGGVCQRAVSVM